MLSKKLPEDRLFEDNFRNWRVLAKFHSGREGLIYVGKTMMGVKENYNACFYWLYDEDDEKDLAEIVLQKWVGPPDAGNWRTREKLPLLAQV